MRPPVAPVALAVVIVVVQVVLLVIGWDQDHEWAEWAGLVLGSVAILNLGWFRGRDQQLRADRHFVDWRVPAPRIVLVCTIVAWLCCVVQAVLLGIIRARS